MIAKLLKILGALVLVILTIGILFYPKGQARKGMQRTITYWCVTGQKEEIPYAATAFNALQDSIYVVANPIPWQEQEKKVLTAILSGNPPDVVSQFIPIVKWASRMALMPLDEYIARDNFDTTVFFPALWQEMRWQGHIFGIPVSSASFAFYYNKKLFREAGLDPERPPQTWDEVREYNRRLTRYDKSGNIVKMGFFPFYKSALVASQNSPSTALIMAWEKGASFLSPDGKVVSLMNPEYIGAMQWLMDYLKPYPTDKLEAFAAGFGYGDQHAFTSQKVAMMILPDIFPDYIKHHAPGLDYGTALTPTFPGCPIASSTGSWWLAIPRGCKDPEAAWEFIKFNAGKELQLDARDARDEILFPSNRLATADPRFLADGSMEIFVTHLEFAHSPTIVPMAHDVFWREFFTAQERVVYGTRSIEKSFRQAQNIIQHELDKSLSYDEYVRSKMSFSHE